MDRIVGEILGRAIGEVIGLVVGAALKSAMSDSQLEKSRSKKTTKAPNLPTPSAPVVQHPRAVLISSSNITFGNECERLVNIAFQTSQTFAGMMTTCAEISSYIRKELEKHHHGTHFHIVIGENKTFGFSVEDGEYFAEIEQERYRVLIFSTKRNEKSKDHSHDANSHLKLLWI